MKITHIIPMYDYLEGLIRISNWINSNYSNIFEDYEIIVYNDKPSIKSYSEYDTVSKFPKFTIIHGEKEYNDLRISIRIGSKNAINKNHDFVVITESDLIPNTDTFKKMISVYNNPFKKPIGSVSAMYKWNNIHCYPTHKHWFTDGKINGNKYYTNIGNVSDVGVPGVPFLFSIWNPNALLLIENENLPKIVGLDSKLGKLVHEKGYHHLRLTECYSEHFQGGKKSWNKLSNKNK